jgi:hypothetical protein
MKRENNKALANLPDGVSVYTVKRKFIQLKNPKAIIDRMGHYDKEKTHSRNCLDFLNQMESENRMVELWEEIKNAEL